MEMIDEKIRDITEEDPNNETDRIVPTKSTEKE